MTITINQISNKTGLLMNGEIFLVVDYQHVKPGKGSAFVRCKLKNVKTDAVLDRTFKSAEKLDDVDLEEKEFEYMYHDGDDYCFMDHSTFEQVHISAGLLGDASLYLLENLVVNGLAHNGQVLKIVLPNFITAQIVETEPGFKGDSVNPGTKPAKIEPGATIQVPLFVNQDDWIKIDTRTGQYVERVQK